MFAILAIGSLVLVVIEILLIIFLKLLSLFLCGIFGIGLYVEDKKVFGIGLVLIGFITIIIAFMHL